MTCIGSRDTVTCHTDSQVALYRIIEDKQWKQFMHNRVAEIREHTPPNCWKHCPGIQNPADIPSRGLSPVELQEKLGLWPPTWSLLQSPTESGETTTTPEQCLVEIKTRDKERLMTLLTSSTQSVILTCESFSCLTRLLRVTAYVFRFVNTLQNHDSSRTSTSDRASLTLTPDEIKLALTYWLKVSQSPMQEMDKFKKRTDQFGLFQDSSSLWRCRGRLQNSDAPPSTVHPILINKATRELCKGDTNGITVEVLDRSSKEIHTQLHCVSTTSKKTITAPTLPALRVNEARQFSHTGVDLAGRVQG